MLSGIIFLALLFMVTVYPIFLVKAITTKKPIYLVITCGLNFLIFYGFLSLG